MSTEEKELTQKQKLFCHYYIEEWNGADAARRAGYSENTAKEIASENLTKPNIQSYIDEIQSDIQKLANVSKLKILNEYKEIAFDDSIDSDNKDKMKALELMSKMLGFNEPDKVDHTTKGDKIESVQFYLPENNRDN